MKSINKKLLLALGVVAAGAVVVSVAKELDEKLEELPKTAPPQARDRNGRTMTGKIHYEDDAYKLYDVTYYLALYNKLTDRTYYMQCYSYGPQTYIANERGDECTLSNGFVLEDVEKAIAEGRPIMNYGEEYSPREWCDYIVRVADENKL